VISREVVPSAPRGSGENLLGKQQQQQQQQPELHAMKSNKGFYSGIFSTQGGYYCASKLLKYLTNIFKYHKIYAIIQGPEWFVNNVIL